MRTLLPRSLARARLYLYTSLTHSYNVRIREGGAEFCSIFCPLCFSLFFRLLPFFARESSSHVQRARLTIFSAPACIWLPRWGAQLPHCEPYIVLILDVLYIFIKRGDDRESYVQRRCFFFFSSFACQALISRINVLRARLLRSFLSFLPRSFFRFVT